MPRGFVPYPRGHIPSMNGVIKNYLDELRFLNRSPGTVRLRGYQLVGWVDWLTASGLDLTSCERAHVVAYLSQFESPETRASNSAAIRGLCGWLVATRQRQSDPTWRLPAVHRNESDVLPVPDAVLSASLAIAGADERAMIVLGRFAGLRAAEIAGAHRRYLRGPNGAEVIRLRGKGGKWRELPAHPEVASVLRARDGWVFPSPVREGVPILPGTVSAKLRDLLPEPWTAHTLRHAFASDVYARTRDIRLVQEWLGHADPRTTARYVQVHRDRSVIGDLRLAA